MLVPIPAPVRDLVRPLSQRLSHWLELKRHAWKPRRRLVVGAGGTRLPGWLHTDRGQLDITREQDWQRLFALSSLDAILAEHVWEHLDAEAASQAAGLCFRYLRPGGHARIAVPDGLHPDPAYIDAVRPGGNGPGADDHRVLHTCRSLSSLFSGAGFEVTLLEHFDEAGHFHQRPWIAADGAVQRSSRNDPRNAGGRLAYTSLILDARKPLTASGQPAPADRLGQLGDPSP